MSAVTARWYLACDLRMAGMPAPLVGDAVLVLTEFLSNSLMHGSPLAGRLIAVSWATADGCLEVAVTDGGGASIPRPSHRTRSSVGGRGLAIVEHLASRWGVRSTDTGTTVWAVLTTPGGSRGGSGAGQTSGRLTGRPAGRPQPVAAHAE
jgi:anti-sigma regulatory factor (Ser/Thr protein kinase)